MSSTFWNLTPIQPFLFLHTSISVHWNRQTHTHAVLCPPKATPIKANIKTLSSPQQCISTWRCTHKCSTWQHTQMHIWNTHRQEQEILSLLSTHVHRRLIEAVKHKNLGSHLGQKLCTCWTFDHNIQSLMIPNWIHFLHLFFFTTITHDLWEKYPRRLEMWENIFFHYMHLKWPFPFITLFSLFYFYLCFYLKCSVFPFFISVFH